MTTTNIATNSNFLGNNWPHKGKKIALLTAAIALLTTTMLATSAFWTGMAQSGILTNVTSPVEILTLAASAAISIALMGFCIALIFNQFKKEKVTPVVNEVSATSLVNSNSNSTDSNIRTETGTGTETETVIEGAPTEDEPRLIPIDSILVNNNLTGSNTIRVTGASSAANTAANAASSVVNGVYNTTRNIVNGVYGAASAVMSTLYSMLPNSRLTNTTTQELDPQNFTHTV